MMNSIIPFTLLEIKHEFICFTTEKLSLDTQEKEILKWAKKMVGHWNSVAIFILKNIGDIGFIF